jgi:hypothetical protein
MGLFRTDFTIVSGATFVQDIANMTVTTFESLVYTSSEKVICT